MKRKYDLGNGVTIEDDGYSIRANIVRGERSSESIGIRRPVKVTDQLKVIYNLSGDVFYLENFAGMHGFWLGVKQYATLEEVKAASPKGLFGSAWAQFTEVDGTTYYRIAMHFTGWDVKHDRSREGETISKDDPLAKDYLGLVQNEQREQEAKFNEAIAHTGKNLKYILDKIGDFQPVAEPPVVAI